MNTNKDVTLLVDVVTVATKDLTIKENELKRIVKIWAGALSELNNIVYSEADVETAIEAVKVRKYGRG